MAESLTERMLHAAAHCETLYDAEWEAGQLREAADEIERLRAELENEQQAKYRLIGQVADMTAEIEALRKELVEANSFIESLSKLCQAAEARAIELQSSPQCGRCGKHSVAEIHTCTPTEWARNIEAEVETLKADERKRHEASDDQDHGRERKVMNEVWIVAERQRKTYDHGDFGDNWKLPTTAAPTTPARHIPHSQPRKRLANTSSNSS